MGLDTIVTTQKEYFLTDATKDVAFRKNALENLLESIYVNEKTIYEALKEDLNKSEEEAFMTEVSNTVSAIKYALKHVDHWSRVERRKTPLTLFPAKSYVVKEPYGIVLILSPWNYPFYLTMAPLVGAIAAGNCAVIKTSKNSPATSGVIADIINSTFPKKYVYAIDSPLPYDEVLNQDYDYIFFTGSERVGRTIMRTAADRLIPISLELGGKSPCIIDRSADIEMAAKKIMWGKTLNSGQTCVAPDYVVVPSELKDVLVERLRAYSKELIGDPFDNEKYPKIINIHHYSRLKGLIEKEEHVIGGRCDDNLRRIEPAIFTDATFDSPSMKEEIFGPILPVIEYEELDDVLNIIKRRPKPLACYIFGQDNRFINKVLGTLSFGGGCINDVIVHLANENLPFGGVGNSGMGSYHGKASFDTFTHEKSIVGGTSSFDVSFKYPPYTTEKYRKLRKFIK